MPTTKTPAVTSDEFDIAPMLLAFQAMAHL